MKVHLVCYLLVFVSPLFSVKRGMRLLTVMLSRDVKEITASAKRDFQITQFFSAILQIADMEIVILTAMHTRHITKQMKCIEVNI